MSVDSGSTSMAARLGIKPGMVVQELGWDEDADEDLRDSVIELAGDGAGGPPFSDGSGRPSG